jgi:glycosyltransferase involved in cell wall biosynthesis
MRQPLFSIITPTYNSLNGLQRSYQSLQDQSPELYEYLIVDGASTDGTSDWLRNLGPATCRWISEPDSGVYHAMNKAISISKGRFLYFLGSGDELISEVLESAAEFIERLPTEKPRFIYGDVRLTNREGRLLGGSFTASRLCRENISHQAIFYERSIFELLGKYDLKYPIYSDWAFNLQCFGDKRIAKYYWNKVVANFESNGLSDRVADVPFAQDRLALIQRYLGSFSNLQFRLERKINRIQEQLYRPSK